MLESVKCRVQFTEEKKKKAKLASIWDSTEQQHKKLINCEEFLMKPHVDD